VPNKMVFLLKCFCSVRFSVGATGVPDFIPAGVLSHICLETSEISFLMANENSFMKKRRHFLTQKMSLRQSEACKYISQN
jgi:hypothetical protein